MYRERIARQIRTRLSRAQFNELEVSIPTRSLADRITIMSEFEFSVHTPAQATSHDVPENGRPLSSNGTPPGNFGLRPKGICESAAPTKRKRTPAGSPLSPES
jgi:hypothetical protein